VLTVRGEKRSLLESNDQSELRVFAAERTTGSFERAVRLPEFIDGDKITADFTNGLLVVSVPKAQAAQPRRIEIKPGARTSGEVPDNGQNS
jgi:HSP20 family protein